MYAVVVEVDNRGEDPEEGKKGLREELAPAIKQFPGFRSGLFLTAHQRGLGVGVVVVDTSEQAEQLAAGFAVGATIRPGVTVVRTEVLEVAASA